MRKNYMAELFRAAHSHRRNGRTVEHILYGNWPICGALPRAPWCEECDRAGHWPPLERLGPVETCKNCDRTYSLIVSSGRLLNVGGPGAKPPALGLGDDDAATTPNDGDALSGKESE